MGAGVERTAFNFRAMKEGGAAFYAALPELCGRLDGCGHKEQSCVLGKSELHRAGCKVIPCEGDFKESATEIYRLFLTGKGGKVR